MREAKLERNPKWGLVVLAGENDRGTDETGEAQGALSFSVGFVFGTFSLKNSADN